MKPTFFKGVALGAATCFVMLAGASALAGTGIGDVFNLGQTNSVDATSELQGTVDGGAQLQVTNQGAGAAIRGDSAGGRGLVANHTNATGASPGLEASTSSTDNNAAAIVGRVLPAGAPVPSAAIRGINSGAGTGVTASSAKGDGLQATTFGPGRVGIRALHLGDGDGSALYAESNASAWAGWFGGRVHVGDDTEVYGDVDLHGRLLGCGEGSVVGWVTVVASSTFAGSYTPISGFSCYRSSIQARRASKGIYFVRFGGFDGRIAFGRGFHAVIGNVYDSTQDDFVAVDLRTDPLDNQPAFRVSVRDADGGNEDLPFMVIVV